ncbi:hypothetical protein [Actinomadura sp. CNU-125]|uniref:hypothetical protein n=1 Tax=Actinomadura sp. CNU-125 TaxID=1904961 RepID=UPI001177BDB2|nr:hypothetical protein [Actinomadura sp. CNU-125]
MSDCVSCDTWKAACQGIICDLKATLAAHGETPEADQLRTHWCEAFGAWAQHLATHLAGASEEAAP